MNPTHHETAGPAWSGASVREGRRHAAKRQSAVRRGARVKRGAESRPPGVLNQLRYATDGEMRLRVPRPCATPSYVKMVDVSEDTVDV